MGLFSSEISSKTMGPMCRQLASTYEAGIPIVRALDVVSQQTNDRNTREVLQRMGARIQQGDSLGEAARSEQHRLPEFFIALVSSGEYGGRLDAMLRDLSSYYEDKVRLQRTVVGALIYPCFQLVAAWVIGSFAISLVNQLDINSTTAFSFENFLVDYLRMQGYAALVLGLGLVAAVVLSRLGLLRFVRGWVAYHLWPFKTLTRKFALARFFRSMSLLIASGLNMKSCITSSAAVTVNPYVERDLMKAVPLVAEGASLTQAFGASRSLTRVSREMLAIGEESGRLEESCRKVAEYHLEEASHAVKVVTKLIGLVALLMVGGIIGYVIITFYSKLYGNIMNAL